MVSPRDTLLAALRERAEVLIRTTDDGEARWRHSERVYGLARRLARQEGGDRFVAGAAALLHDLATTTTERLALAKDELARQAVPAPDQAAILAALRALMAEEPPETLEARLLSDADRLDDLGAFGIARLFGASDPAALHDRTDPFALFRELIPATYQIDRLFARLLRLPGEMRTPAGRAIANRRLAIMLIYLETLREEIAETLPDAILPERDWLVPEEGGEPTA